MRIWADLKINNGLVAAFLAAAASTPFWAHDDATAKKELAETYQITPTEVGAKSYTDYPFAECWTSTYNTRFRGMTKDGVEVKGVFCNGPLFNSHSIVMEEPSSRLKTKIEQSFDP